MTLLKHEPSAQIPWQNTMLGFAELLTVEPPWLQVCAPSGPFASYNAISGGICRSCRCCGDSRSGIVIGEPLAQEAHARVGIDVTNDDRDCTRYYRIRQALR